MNEWETILPAINVIASFGVFVFFRGDWYDDCCGLVSSFVHFIAAGVEFDADPTHLKIHKISHIRNIQNTFSTFQATTFRLI